MTRTLPFYFDYISPYAYLGWAQTSSFASAHGVDFEPHPIVFAALLNRWGHKGPAEIPPKRLFTFRDIFRRAHSLNIPITFPDSHPFNPLLALRTTLAAPADQRSAVVHALYKAIWGEGKNPNDPSELSAALQKIAPDRGPEWVELATSPEVKAELHASTDRALAAGVFGVPSIVVDGQVLWGHDQFPILESILEGKDPAESLTVEALDKLTPSAQRTPSSKGGPS